MYPEYELGLQIFTEEQADAFSFDVLDPTKIVPGGAGAGDAGRPDGAQPQPRQLLRRDRAGRVLRREHRAGHRLHQRPAAAGRIHSYFDTQLLRLGGPNFHEIPINAPIAQVHNNQRDGFHRQAIHRGRVAYEPNSLGGGCPFQAGERGLRAFPSRSRTTRCAASRRSSPTTTRRRPSSGTARRPTRRRTSFAPSASS